MVRLLQVIDGPSAGRTVTLERELVIGREGADLTIDDPEMSRRHTVVRPTAGGVEIEDLGSMNGTFVNDEQIAGTVLLESPSRLRIGTTNLAVEFTAPVAEPDVTKARATPPVAQADVTKARATPPVAQPDVTKARATPPVAQPDVTKARATPAMAEPDLTQVRRRPSPGAPDASPSQAAASSSTTEGFDPAEVPFFRWAYRMVFAVAGLGIAASVLHPQPEPDAIAPAEGSFLDTILGFDLWIPIHLTGLVSYWLSLFVLMALYRSVRDEPARSVARVAAAFGVLSTGFVSVWISIDMVSIVQLADIWEANPTNANLAAINAVEEVILALFSMAVVLFLGVTAGLFGVAMLMSRLYPRWIGIWGIVGGAANVLVGGAQLITSRDEIVTDILVPVVLSVMSVWLLVATIVMWRGVQATVASRPTATG